MGALLITRVPKMHGDTVPWVVVPLKEKLEGSLGIEAGAIQVQGHFERDYTHMWSV